MVAMVAWSALCTSAGAFLDEVVTTHRKKATVNKGTLGAIVMLGVLTLVSLSNPIRRSTVPGVGDLWIMSALESVIERDGHDDLNRVSVTAREGVVTLDGMVLTDAEKGLAERLASEIPGIRAVENTIRVTPALSRDLAIEKAVRAELVEDPLVHIRDLRVRADDGVVTVAGIVSQRGEERLARALVAKVPDVGRVIDKLETAPRI